MGQRFQIYVKTDFEIIGYHLQWCWGHFSLIRADQLLRFINSDIDSTYPIFKDKHRIEDRIEIVKNLIQINYENLSFVDAYGLSDKETENPRRADNNDGILVVDCSNDRLAYCFTDPYDKSPSPMDAKKYMKDYTKKPDDKYYSAEVEEIADRYIRKLQAYKLLSKKDLVYMFPKMFEGSLANLDE